jgi:hypothetical protein
MPYPQSGHPGSGVHVPGLLWGLAGIVGAIGFALAVAWWSWTSLRPAHPPAPMRIAAPRLQSAPQLDLAAYNAEKARLTNGTAWVDRPGGIARIPVDDAMQLLVTRARGKK